MGAAPVPVIAAVIVLGAVSAAALLVLISRRPGSAGSSHGSPLAWRHHLGCSLADTTTSTSSTIFLASDLCISINHRDGSVETDPAAAVPAAAVPAAAPATGPSAEPGSAPEPFAAPEPVAVPEQVAASEPGDPDEVARLEILLLERLWEISPDAEDDRV